MYPVATGMVGGWDESCIGHCPLAPTVRSDLGAFSPTMQYTVVWEELKAIVDSMGGGELSSRRTKTASTSSEDSPAHQTRSPFH